MWGWLLLGHCLLFASVPLSAALAVFLQRVLRQVTLTGLRKLFWLQLPVLLLRWSSVSWVCGVWWGAWFSTLCGAFLPGPAVLGSLPCRRWPACGFCHCLPGLPLRRWLRLGCNPPLVFSVLLRWLACGGSLGFFTLCPGALMVAATALWVMVWGCLMAPHSSRACFLLCHLLLQFSPSVGAVLCSLLGFHCLRVGAPLACGIYSSSSLWGLLSRLPLVVGPPPPVLVGPSPALAMRWFGRTSVTPPAATVLGSCGVSVALFCRLGLLRALPCRVFACGFPWFRGPISWCFLGLFTMVLSSRFRWLWMARGGCCLRFVQGPLAQAGAVLLACVSLGGCPSFSQVGPARSPWVPLLWTWCVCGLSQFPPPHVFFWDVVTRWVNRVFLSLLIANEGLRC